ncbi:hypothetical protein MR532_05300 [bacterium]|nr:hypothetical protein [bacterium]
MQRQLIDYIRRPESLGAHAIAHLEAMTSEYPYFHAARILYLQALHRQHSQHFDEALRRSSVLVPDRQALFRLIEEPKYNKVEERRKYTEDNYPESRSDLTYSLIDDFLRNNCNEPQAPRTRHRIDATQDYIGYLMQNEQDEQQTGDDIQMNGGGVVEDFLSQDNPRIVLNDSPSTSTETPKEIETEPERDILTEVMAGIYIKQGHFENAIKILRQLSLKYPKKNRYFADQIRFLEKLIINNKNK